VARYVRTPAGEKRYGLPIGSLIGSGKGRGRLSNAVKKAARAADSAAEAATPDEPKKKRPRLVRTEAGARRYGVPIGQPIPTKADKAKQADKPAEKPSRGKLSPKKTTAKKSTAKKAAPEKKTTAEKKTTSAESRSQESRGRLSPKKTTAKKAAAEPRKEQPKRQEPPPPPRTPPAPPPPPTLDEMKQGIRDAIRQIEKDLGKEKGSWFMLSTLRDRLPAGWSRQEVDRALLALVRDPDVFIVPENNQKALNQKEREAALWMGNQWRHVIRIG
jgi:hypothetical protein